MLPTLVDTLQKFTPPPPKKAHKYTKSQWKHIKAKRNISKQSRRYNRDHSR